jgi:hypothetical protein
MYRNVTNFLVAYDPSCSLESTQKDGTPSIIDNFGYCYITHLKCLNRSINFNSIAYCNGFGQRVTRQRLCKHGSIRNIGTVLCNPFLSNRTVNASIIIVICCVVRAAAI